MPKWLTTLSFAFGRWLFCFINRRQSASAADENRLTRHPFEVSHFLRRMAMPFFEAVDNRNRFGVAQHRCNVGNGEAVVEHQQTVYRSSIIWRKVVFSTTRRCWKMRAFRLKNPANTLLWILPQRRPSLRGCGYMYSLYFERASKHIFKDAVIFFLNVWSWQRVEQKKTMQQLIDLVHEHQPSQVIQVSAVYTASYEPRFSRQWVVVLSPTFFYIVWKDSKYIWLLSIAYTFKWSYFR